MFKVFQVRAALSHLNISAGYFGKVLSIDLSQSKSFFFNTFQSETFAIDEENRLALVSQSKIKKSGMNRKELKVM